MIDLLKNQQNNKNLITFLNPYSYLLARKNKELFSKFNIKIDGIFLVKVLNLFGFKDKKRESFDMTSLAPVVFENASSENKSIYFVGTKPDIIKIAVQNIKNTYPKLNIVGYRDGYFKENENRFINTLKEVNPDIVICGMGAILQEKFLVALNDAGWNGIGYTCGGFLHQTAKNIEYYPKWIDKCNLRWLYRLHKEPATRKRFFIEYPKFIFMFVYDYYCFKLNKNRLNKS